MNIKLCAKYRETSSFFFRQINYKFMRSMVHEKLKINALLPLRTFVLLQLIYFSGNLFTYKMY